MCDGSKVAIILNSKSKDDVSKLEIDQKLSEDNMQKQSSKDYVKFRE